MNGPSTYCHARTLFQQLISELGVADLDRGTIFAEIRQYRLGILQYGIPVEFCAVGEVQAFSHWTEAAIEEVSSWPVGFEHLCAESGIFAWVVAAAVLNAVVVAVFRKVVLVAGLWK